MKKNEKIVISILVLILIVMIGVLFFTKIKVKQNLGTNVGNQNVQNQDAGVKDHEQVKIIKVNGTLYYNTGIIDNTPRCGTMDGNITSIVKETEIPIKDGEVNFEGAKGYQYGSENTIQVLTEEGWIIFEAELSSFVGLVKQVEKNCIFVEPNDGESIRKTADLISIGLIDDTIYQVGEFVQVTYDGHVMETYPAQISAINIEKQKFIIKVYDTPVNKTVTILDKSETDKYDYNIYALGVDVNIIINGEENSLRDALLQDKLTMEEIIAKADEDNIDVIEYGKGGVKEYSYGSYSIKKYNTMDGNRDVYIEGPQELAPLY